jgi:hypothetical protein
MHIADLGCPAWCSVVGLILIVLVLLWVFGGLHPGRA